MTITIGMSLLILNTTMLIVNAFVTAIQSSIIMKSVVQKDVHK